VRELSQTDPLDLLRKAIRPGLMSNLELNDYDGLLRPIVFSSPDAPVPPRVASALMGTVPVLWSDKEYLRRLLEEAEQERTAREQLKAWRS